MRTSKLGCSLLFFVSCLMAASAAHAQDGCPDGRVCVSGNRFKPYDPWQNDPDGGFGGGGSGGGSAGGSTDIGGGSGSGAGQVPPPPQKTPEEKKRDCDRADETRKEATKIWAQGLITMCVERPITGQIADAVRSVLAGVAVSSAIKSEIRECINKEYSSIVQKMDENTVEYNRCIK
ncbi:hypothetical protein [Roseateles sp.]|jgi:hypothetical protein|uniref:hypothetical protein n=1 Tax=Roseateles sp. TaxID=1971397 RepID=UPI003D0C12FD